MPKSLYQMISPDIFMIPKDKVSPICQLLELSINDLLQQLVPLIKEHAIPPISNYYVGAAALGKSGNIYLGVNLEFPSTLLNHSIHAEQFAIINARNHGETEIVAIAVSAAPCGHCRQFLNEVGKNMSILIHNLPATTLYSLLPDAFGPKDLGLSGNLLSLPKEPECSPQSSLIKNKAMEALQASYAPYSQSKSGVAIRTCDSNIYLGSYLENAAFNPTVSPLQAALITLVADRRHYSDITEVMLLEQDVSKVSHAITTQEILRRIAPEANLMIEKISNPPVTAQKVSNAIMAKL